MNKLKVLVVFFSEYLAGNCDKNNDNTLERIFVSDGKLLSDAGGVQDKIVAVLTRLYSFLLFCLLQVKLFGLMVRALN